ncbi:MAG: tryptophan--tRNA ligase [Nanoarchaeota archaeon]|nr:tryptophan--tRNA ligase [Nanoarchaeota archaeon]|tara:strand:- start:1231 stop:2334 length:1104 start_codon:yes stop_codon:yes gene_type:complete
MKVTPWEVSGNINYDKLIKDFGVKHLPTQLPKKLQSNILFKRKTIFAHRDFEIILDCIKNRKPFVMMTGLMPSGKFHLGHRVVADQIILYQKLGAKIYLAVADTEAYNSRNPNLEELKKVAIKEYLINYIALGLSTKNLDFYFQSQRSKDGVKSNAYYSLANLASRHATFNEFKSIYGEIDPGKMTSSLLQTADMLHPQLKEFENKPLPTIIPVGIDQDPHLKIARDISQRIKIFKFQQLSSTYHTFLPGLNSGKMSSSDPNSYIALTDSASEVDTKIKKYAFSGGQKSLDEHRKKGGNPNIDVSFIYLKTFFEPNDNKLKKLHDDYSSGKLLTSELKAITVRKINSFLKKHQKKREKAKKQIDKFI